MKKHMLIAMLLCISCTVEGSKPMQSFEITSPSFKNETTIPKKFTCEGTNISPTLEWKNAPQATKSFTLVVDDPDAPNGTWDHWIVFNIPGSVTQIAEGKLPASAKQGITSFKKREWGGPCPPQGHGVHHYHFKLYALDTLLSIKEGSTKSVVEQAMQGHILAQANLVGLYEKK